jgi:diacylglycerol kinase (ATP)
VTSSRVVLLVNPASGKGRAAPAASVLAARLRERGHDVVLVQAADAARSLTQLRDAVQAAPTAAVVACGGDGTVHLCLQVVAGTDIALGMLPIGTGNDSATHLGIPAHPRAAADVVADALATGRRRILDAGHVSAADGEQRWYLGVLSSGFDSLVNERANVMTWPRGQARYLRAILAELRVFRPVPYTMVLDEGLASEVRQSKRGMLVAVGNGMQYGGGMKVCPGALMDDGLLAVTFLDELRTTTFLRVFPSVYKGTHVARPEVHEHAAVTVWLEAPGQVAYADGERVGPLPVRIRVVPGAVAVLVPSPGGSAS